MGVSKTNDHIQIKIKMPNPSQEPPASSKAPNEDLKDMDVLCTFKIKIESQISDHGYIKDQWPYSNQDQDAKPHSRPSNTLQDPTESSQTLWTLPDPPRPYWTLPDPLHLACFWFPTDPVGGWVVAQPMSRVDSRVFQKKLFIEFVHGVKSEHAYWQHKHNRKNKLGLSCAKLSTA